MSEIFQDNHGCNFCGGSLGRSRIFLINIAQIIHMRPFCCKDCKLKWIYYVQENRKIPNPDLAGDENEMSPGIDPEDSESQNKEFTNDPEPEPIEEEIIDNQPKILKSSFNKNDCSFYDKDQDKFTFEGSISSYKSKWIRKYQKKGEWGKGDINKIIDNLNNYNKRVYGVINPRNLKKEMEIRMILKFELLFLRKNKKGVIKALCYEVEINSNSRSDIKYCNKFIIEHLKHHTMGQIRKIIKEN